MCSEFSFLTNFTLLHRNVPHISPSIRSNSKTIIFTNKTNHNSYSTKHTSYHSHNGYNQLHPSHLPLSPFLTSSHEDHELQAFKSPFLANKEGPSSSSNMHPTNSRISCWHIHYNYSLCIIPSDPSSRYNFSSFPIHACS